jgi:tRNA-Thr(GGU) m(6)t(6)A37 methyltransferase TsaA
MPSEKHKNSGNAYDSYFSLDNLCVYVSERRFEYERIGVIRTPFDSPEGMPIQPVGADDTEGTVKIDGEYSDGLQNLDGFSHCILIYHFHETDDGFSLLVEPFLDDRQRGLFSTRTPLRPNPIGMSVVGIDAVTGDEVAVRGIDVVDGTPLLDIKPFVPEFDAPEDTDTGWLEASEPAIRSERSDERFL